MCKGAIQTNTMIRGLVILLLATGCGKRDAVVTSRQEVMDTVITVSVPRDQGETLQVAISALTGFGDRIWPLIDVYNPRSEIARANQIAAQSRFPISRDTHRIVEYGQRLSISTQGSYDITDATVRHLWRRHLETNPQEPLPTPLTRASVAQIGADKIQLAPQSISYRSRDVQLDVNQLAQAYIIDTTIIQLRGQGLRHVFIESDAVARGLGAPSGRTAWRRPIYHPDKPDTLLGHVRLSDGSAMAMSGMEGTYAFDSERYARTVDPRSGRLAQGTLFTAVLGPVAMESLAYAQATMVTGIEGATALHQREPRYNFLIIPDHDPVEIWITPDLATFFDPEPQYKKSVHLIK